VAFRGSKPQPPAPFLPKNAHTILRIPILRRLNSSCSSSWLTIVTADEPEPEADEYDLSLHSVSCEDCISDDFQGGESTKWTVKLENSGDKTLYGADFEIRLVPQAYVESACSGGSYSYYTAKYVELGGDCYALYSGGGCAAVVYATVPNVSGDWYKWVIEADPYDAWDESNERNNRSCVNDWIYVY